MRNRLALLLCSVLAGIVPIRASAETGKMYVGEISLEGSSTIRMEGGPLVFRLRLDSEQEAVGVPVLEAGSGITTSAFSIAWSSVSGETKYTVQVAESATFDEGIALEASFADGTMPPGWATNKVTFANNKTTFSGDGTGVAVFAGKGHWLRTPLLARPGVMGWSHAKNTGSGAGTAWSYVVECSATEDFADVTWSETVEVNDSVTVPVAEVADLTGQRNVYVRWRDTRTSGTAQRYLSEITVLDALSAETTTTGTSAAFTGLATSTVYYVRVKATTETGDSDWSTTQTVTTADPPSATRTTPVPVPYSWLDGWGLAGGGDYEAAACALAANGANAVWECYVAGLDPTNGTSRLLAMISMTNGAPCVTWTPDLNEGGTKHERVYTVEGKAALTNDWDAVDADSRFFRVKVSMPE